MKKRKYDTKQERDIGQEGKEKSGEEGENDKGKSK
jgi:hypothetical protein